MFVHDDLGHELTARPAERVVSLVPSLTESIASVRPEAIVGATDWCSHPPDLITQRVRGTKNPDVAAIIELAPDLVVANKEENRRLDVGRLRAAGVRVWVTDVRTVPDGLASLTRLFAEALRWPEPDWLDTARRQWSAPPPEDTVSAAIPVWRDPWMVVGSSTFAGDLAERVGLRNVFADSPDRYPHVSIGDILDRDPELVVLPDEPYRFTEHDGPECFPPGRTVLVPGRLLTWYGPSLATARDDLRDRLAGRDQG